MSEKTAAEHWDYIKRVCGPQRFIQAKGVEAIDAALAPKKVAPIKKAPAKL
tara:strand:- start:6085 stop:6237 length:153 start_codon:yes stop_codon:yes gene_type:complete